MRTANKTFRLEQADRQVCALAGRKIRENLAKDTGEFEAVARARRRQDDPRRVWVKTENKMFVGTARIDTYAGSNHFARRRGNIVLKDFAQLRLFEVGDLGAGLFGRRKVAAAEMCDAALTPVPHTSGKP